MEQTEEQMFGFNVGDTALCGLIPPQENHSARGFRVAFEHFLHPPFSLLRQVKFFVPGGFRAAPTDRND